MLGRKLRGGLENLSISGGFDDLLSKELDFLDEIFKSDSKNYHAWSHKIWVVERFELWD